MEILSFIAVMVATYYVMSFIQTWLHRDFGHRKRIKAVFTAHTIGHHGLYNRNNLQTDEFEDCESHALNYYGIPVVAVAIVVYFVAGPLIMFANIVGVYFTLRWHLYLHEHYHLKQTYLERFGWFREKRRLHFIHHRDAGVNFAVVEFWMDNLLGTRQNA